MQFSLCPVSLQGVSVLQGVANLECNSTLNPRGK